MPAEWEAHEAVWMAWPYDQITFPDRVEKAEKVFRQIIEALSGSERVELLVRDHVDISNANQHIVDYADVWTRDYAPSFVRDDSGAVKGVKWEYNAYGKFPDLLKDNQAFSKLDTGIDLVKTNILMEGGAIEVNGAGKLITTEQCLFTRNPNFKRPDYEKIFSEYLGVNKVIWLEKGIVGDHTDGHVDEVTRFVAENKVVVASEDDPKDENYAILKSAEVILKKENLEIVKLPMPKVYSEAGERQPASYVNFYIGNKVVLVPVFGLDTDSQAQAILAKLFPGRKVIGIDCRDLIYGGGSIHCITQQQPK